MARDDAVYVDEEPSSGGGWRAPRWLRRENWPLLIFLGLSWTSTTFGLTRLIAADRGEPELVEYFIIGAFVFAATASMKLMLDLALTIRQPLRRAAALVGYLLLMGFSIFFGFAFYWELLEARAQTFDGARGALASADRALSQSRATLGAVARDVEGLRRISAEMAERERREGRTCEANIGAGDGPRRVFRDAEAARFEADARNLTSRLTVIDTELARIDSQIESLNTLAETREGGDQALRDGFNAINGALVALESNYNAILTAGGVGGLRADYSSAAQGYRDPGFVRTGPNAQGRPSRFICHDPALARQLDRIVVSIGSLSTLRFAPVEILKDARATEEAFDRLSGSIMGAVASIDVTGALGDLWEDGQAAILGAANDGGGSGGGSAGGGSSGGPAAGPSGGGLIEDDYLPLFAASIVDVMILIFTLIEGPQFRSRLDDVQRGIDRAKRADVNAKDLVDLSRRIATDPCFQLLEDYRFTFRDRDYVAVPIAAPGMTLAALDDFDPLAPLETAERADAPAPLALPAAPKLLAPAAPVAEAPAAEGRDVNAAAPHDADWDAADAPPLWEEDAPSPLELTPANAVNGHANPQATAPSVSPARARTAPRDDAAQRAVLAVSQADEQAREEAARAQAQADALAATRAEARRRRREALIQGDQAVGSLMRAFAAKGLARRARPLFKPSPAAISKSLALRGSPAAGRADYELYAIDREAWAEVIDGFYSDARDSARPAEAVLFR